MKTKTMQLVSFLVFIGMSECAFGKYSTQTANVPVVVRQGTSAPPPGMIVKSTGDPSTSATQDPREESVWRVAKQLALTADQRTELASAMKAEKGQRADLDRALQDARRALANAFANGQTFLDPEIESLTSANAKVQESNLKLWAKLYALLSPDQQRRLLTMSTPLSLASASHELARNQ